MLPMTSTSSIKTSQREQSKIHEDLQYIDKADISVRTQNKEKGL